MKCPNCGKEITVAWICEEDRCCQTYWRHIDLKENEEDVETEDLMTMNNDYLEDCRQTDVDTFDYCYNCDTAIV